MEDKVVRLIKDKPLFIPRVLINNYKKLGITEEELVIIIVLLSYEENTDYDPERLSNEVNSDKHDIMRIINSLCDKNILSVEIEKNNRKTREYISLDLLYEKLFNMVIGTKEEKEIDNSIFSVFENELGRPLSPMEYEMIKEWINSDNSTEMISLALREAVMNGVSNFNYIDKILSTWKKKGYKNKQDVMKDKEKYQEKREKVDVFDTDWLND